MSSLTSDPDGDVTSYELVQQSFGTSGFKFTFSAANGYHAFTYPATATSGAQIWFKWRAHDSKGNVSNTATFTFTAVSC